MPDASTVAILVDKYGWPGLTVVVLLAILRYLMVKHEARMGKITEINQQIVANLTALAGRLEGHDKDEERRHDVLKDRLERLGR